MNTNFLFYNIHKGTVTTRDYINWSHHLLNEGISSYSLNIFSSCSPFDNIFEIESFFNRALKELAIKQPPFEASAGAYIDFLAMKIMETNHYKRIFHFADRIFKVVAVELDYPDDLLPWIEISERIDRIHYAYEKDVILKIKNEAKLLLRSNHKGGNET